MPCKARLALWVLKVRLAHKAPRANRVIRETKAIQARRECKV